MPNDEIVKSHINRITKLRNKYLAKLDLWETNYQCSGTGKINTKYEYEDIISACNLALENLNDECGKCKRTSQSIGALRSHYNALSRDRDTVEISKIIDDLYSL